jgi:hypothetical protein
MAKQIISAALFKSIESAFTAEESVIGAAVSKTDAVIQKAVDAHLVACKVPKAEYIKGNARTNAARAEVASMFGALAEKGHFSEKTAAQYASCFWAAFSSGQPFSRTTLNKPVVKAGAKAGKVEPAGVASYDLLVRQAKALIKTARALDNDALAAALIDVMSDHVEFDGSLE